MYTVQYTYLSNLTNTCHKEEAICSWGLSRAQQHTDKNENKFSSYIRNSEGLGAKSYTTKDSSYIYDFAPDPI
jgi:hypothetical protein